MLSRRTADDPPPGASDTGVRGWCPTAWRPMMAGDGLLVRVRPPLGIMTRPQALALCEAAQRWGNGHIDLTNRAALQIRGVREADHPALLEGLVALGLTDADPAREARANLILNPDWQPGDSSEAIARALLDRLADLPNLPAKMGFAIDAGPAPALSDTPADFRIERGSSGGLILRAEGRDKGTPVSEQGAADALIALAHWFIASGGSEAGRMARHTAPLPTSPSEQPAPPRSRAASVAHAPGRFHAAPFGRIDAEELQGALEGPGVNQHHMSPVRPELVEGLHPSDEKRGASTGSAQTRPDAPNSAQDALNHRVHAIRLTPWRGLLFEGSMAPSDDPADPLLSAHACPGAPACPQASVATRALAARLAPHVVGLHVSGCAKGCAHPRQAPVVLTGRDGRFDLSFHARAGAPPARTGLGPDQLIALFGAS